MRITCVPLRDPIVDRNLNVSSRHEWVSWLIKSNQSAKIEHTHISIQSFTIGGRVNVKRLFFRAWKCKLLRGLGRDALGIAGEERGAADVGQAEKQHDNTFETWG